jgi:hypothetical protein
VATVALSVSGRYRGRIWRFATGAIMAKGCPVCGNKTFKPGPVEPNPAIRATRKICAKCGRECLVPRADYVNMAAAYLIAAILTFFVLVDWLAPPRDWPIHFTWYGRVAVLGCSAFLFGIATMALAGKPWR